MPEVDPHSEDGDRETDDTSSEFDELFSEDTDDESNDDAPVTRSEFNNLMKGVKKLATDKGRKEKEATETEGESGEEPKKEVPPRVDTDDVSELFFAQIPQAEAVQDDLKTIADAKYNGSIVKAWRGEKWLQDKANALNDEKVQDDKNKAKISPPRAGKSSGDMAMKDIDLSNPEHKKWLHAKGERLDKYAAWKARN